MIRKPNNWNEVQEFADRPKLPLGAYVCRVKKAVIQPNNYGEQLCLLVDIAEGEQKDFFSREFNSSTLENKKWKGVLRLWIPKDDGSEKDEWTKSTFKGMVTSIEKSNPGYQWNWDETSLPGKFIGILFRNEEWEYGGKTGWAVRPFRAMSIDSVRSGDFTLPQDKPLKNKAQTASNSNSYVPGLGQGYSEVNSDDDEFPF